MTQTNENNLYTCRQCGCGMKEDEEWCDPCFDDDDDSNKQLVISPIAKKYKNKPGVTCSKRDYEEQQERLSNGEQLMWDDTPHNNSRCGDHFGFYRYKIDISIHEVEKVLDPSARLPSWQENIGQRDRNVLYLSKDPIKVITWDEWVDIGGAKRCMGTTHVKKNLERINAQIFM